MYLYVFIYMCIYTYIGNGALARGYLRQGLLADRYMYIYIHIYKYIYIYIYVYTYLYVYIKQICICICLYKANWYININTFMRMHIYLCI
jgi:uncharacterized membrane protein